MTIYAFILSLLFSLFITACQTTPDAPLSPKLDKYSLIQENCEELRLTPGIHVPDALDKECRTFLVRLDKANAFDYKLAQLSKKADPTVKAKPEFILLQTDANRQHRKTEVEYEKFCDLINEISLNAIKEDQLSDVELTLSFPETIFTKKHYDYYKEQAPQHHNDHQFLVFEKKYATELVIKGLDYLSTGDKKRAIKQFKTAAKLHNAQAEYLVGIIYEAKHVSKAIEWHIKAKDNGVKSSRIHLARLYQRNREPKVSQSFYLEAAEDEDAYAQYILYQQYTKTSNTKSNAQAKKWVKRSAENGFPLGEYSYGKALLNEKKREDAKKWLNKAQEHGISAANATLGTLYFDDKDYKKALNYLTLAESGYAKYRLANMYEKGLGVEINYYQSYMLYKEATKLGYKKAKKDAARLTKLKTSREQARYNAAKRKEKQRLDSMSKRCGEEPILRNLRTEGMKIKLSGLVSLPMEGAHGFIVNSEDEVIGIEMQKTVLSAKDESGRASVEIIKGSDFRVEADVIIFALGFSPSNPNFLAENGIEVNKWGAIEVDKNHETSASGVYAGGDCKRGSDLVVTAAAEGKDAASFIVKSLLS